MLDYGRDQLLQAPGSLMSPKQWTRAYKLHKPFLPYVDLVQMFAIATEIKLGPRMRACVRASECVCLRACVRVRGQETTSGASPHLLPCLSQGLLVHCCVYTVNWPASSRAFSCLSLSSCCRNVITPQTHTTTSSFSVGAGVSSSGPRAHSKYFTP